MCIYCSVSDWEFSDSNMAKWFCHMKLCKLTHIFQWKGKKKGGGVSPWEGYPVQMNTSLQTPNLCHVCYHSFAEQHDELG